MFGSIRQLQKQAHEIDKTWDPGAQMADAQARMTQATAMMAQQTAAANAAANGVEAAATVVAVRQGAGMVNFQPIVDVDLTVLPSGLPPYPVTVSGPMDVTLAGRLAPGASLRVKVDPENPSSVWIDPTSAA